MSLRRGQVSSPGRTLPIGALALHDMPEADGVRVLSHCELESAQFQMTGAPQTYERRSFCPICGSRLFFLFDDGVEIFLGTLDQAPNGIKPMVEVWTIRREQWLAPVSGASPYDENSPNG